MSNATNSNITAMSDADLLAELNRAISRHDWLIDCCDMGDVRIYFANKRVDVLTAEITRRNAVL